MPIENKNYKDTVFRLLYNDKHRLLELYNAINNSNYTNPDDLTITTLEGETFLKMKNDLSFLLAFELNLFEHQSSPCPNIPLRDLQYVASLYKELIPSEKTYQTKRIEIPTPKFIVFYNGTVALDDVVTYRLSDMFTTKTDTVDLELIVTLYNVNEGHNKHLMDACRSLKDYSIFVSKVRKYKEIYIKDSEGFEASEDDVLVKYAVRKAVTRAIDECVNENVLKEFFVNYREEVIEVGVLEYSAERHIQVIRDESYSMGYEDKEKELKPIIDELTSEKETLISEKKTLTSKNEDLTSKNEDLTSKNEDLTSEITRLRDLLKKNGIDA